MVDFRGAGFHSVFPPIVLGTIQEGRAFATCTPRLAACLALLLIAGSVFAQAATDTYPTKPIRIVVPFGPGSGTDTVTRLVGQHL